MRSGDAVGSPDREALRVAMVAPPFVRVPPPQYGGTEVVVAELVDGLVDSGAAVTLFATRDSTGGFRRRCPVRGAFRRGQWPPSLFTELLQGAFALEDLLGAANLFDVVHAHCPTFLPLARMLRLPAVYTLHHPFDAALCALYEKCPDVHFVAISARQRRDCGPFLKGHVVHHGLDPARFGAGPPGDFVAFLGRLSRVKGPHVAIDAAARAGLPIQVAGRPHEDDAAFFREEVLPRMSLPHVTYLGEVAQAPKVALLSRARALLFPIDWEEPFGLVMIEAMLCGCPVVAFKRGAVPEVVEEGVTGFWARDLAHMAALLVSEAHPDRFDRARCRRTAAHRFGADRMVQGYRTVYEAAIVERASAAGLPAGPAGAITLPHA